MNETQTHQNKTAGGVAAPTQPQTDKEALSKFLFDILPAEGRFALWTRHNKQHVWVGNHADLRREIEKRQDMQGVYFATAAFGDQVSPKTGDIARTQSNVTARRAFHLDFDAGAAKMAKHGPDEVYATQDEASRDLVRFIKETGLMPTYIVSSGEGLHVYFCLSEDISEQEWKPAADALSKLVARHGLKQDHACTTDSARILRPLGTLHDNGKRVETLKHTGKFYTLAQFAEKVGAGALDAGAVPRKRERKGINDDVLTVQGPPKSITLILEKCPAMGKVAAARGNVSEPLWRAMLGVVKHTVEGEQVIHNLSDGHPEYDRAETQAKYDRWAAGPTTCAQFELYCPTECSGCKYRGKITSPIQTGAVVEVTPPGTQAADQTDTVPDYVAQLNARHALVRRGAEMVILDERTPTVTARGVTLGRGWLHSSAFRQMYQGRVVEVETPVGETKRLPLASVWLNHTGRRQYDGTVFAPLEEVPENILNLYAGFAVPPQAGDVTPWLELLEALIPDIADRKYVARWLAWKVQNPGGVPDTILILTGKKGTGKNSLFDPLIVLFGIHAMLVDNPELIAGRFTGHLMDKCFVVLDEAVFTRDPRQQDAMKSRTTAKVMMYEDKGMPPVSGINRCAYVMLTNHEHVWQATTDERRAVVVEVGDGLRGSLGFWKRYHAWVKGDGPAALLHHLQQMDLSGFDPRAIPKGEALRKQIELTALRDPAVAWWHRCLSEGAVRCRDGGMDRVLVLNTDEPTEVDVHLVRESYEQTAGSRGANGTSWPQVAKRLHAWCGPAGLHKARPRADTGVRLHRYTMPPLAALREHFTKATNVVLEP